MAQIEDIFLEVFGQAPQVLSEAPGRVNLIGEHIDYSEGFVLPFAISNRTYAAIARNNLNIVRIASHQRKGKVFSIDVNAIRPGSAGDWERYVLGVLWTLQIKDGVDILINGNVPAGAGLSSSAALECSVAVALNLLFELGLSSQELARATQKAENEYVGVPCGIMDQSVSLMAKQGSALLLDCRDLTTQSIPFDVASQGLELLIIDTQAHHALIDGGYAERRASCESVAKKFGITSMRTLNIQTLEARRDELSETEYLRARHAVTEINRVMLAVDALKSKDFAALGKLLNQSHNSLRDDYTVSCPELDAAVDAAMSAGALGARMVGGGFGGSAIALISAQDMESVKRSVKQAFASRSFKTPRFFTSLPSSGASADFFH